MGGASATQDANALQDVAQDSSKDVSQDLIALQVA
jgi:hypothetical protein